MISKANNSNSPHTAGCKKRVFVTKSKSPSPFSLASTPSSTKSKTENISKKTNTTPIAGKYVSKKLEKIDTAVLAKLGIDIWPNLVKNPHLLKKRPGWFVKVTSKSDLHETQGTVSEVSSISGSGSSSIRHPPVASLGPLLDELKIDVWPVPAFLQSLKPKISQTLFEKSRTSESEYEPVPFFEDMTPLPRDPETKSSKRFASVDVIVPDGGHEDRIGVGWKHRPGDFYVLDSDLRSVQPKFELALEPPAKSYRNPAMAKQPLPSTLEELGMIFCCCISPRNNLTTDDTSHPLKSQTSQSSRRSGSRRDSELTPRFPPGTRFVLDEAVALRVAPAVLGKVQSRRKIIVINEHTDSDPQSVV